VARKQFDLPELSPAQREIMEIVWQRGEVTATEVRRVLAQTRKVARNTVRTLLERMEEKGWLKHRAEGRTFLYAAARPRQASIGQKVREIVETICGGSPETLVTALLDYRGLRADELRRIRQLLEQAQAGKVQKGDW
jgi:BlaI family penicillinase repressor